MTQAWMPKIATSRRAARKSTAEGTSRGNAPIAAVEFLPLTSEQKG